MDKININEYINNLWINMERNKNLEKRIEILEKEVKHLKAILQYQLRNKKTHT